ncbi:MAG: thioredoxin family protein [Butyricimonas paravirosa]
MEIKVLGSWFMIQPGEMIEKIVKENQLDATLSKVEDIVELLNYGIMTTPAIVVDGEVKLKGHVPTESEIKKILGI